jgi:hypothetical protein
MLESTAHTKIRRYRKKAMEDEVNMITGEIIEHE